MTTPKDWWKDLQSTKPGPARIRITFNRWLTPAEQEHLRTLGTTINRTAGDKLRLNRDGRLYVESVSANSRQLFDAVATLVAFSFVNVFPTAVRTFRELVFAKGGLIEDAPKLREVAKRERRFRRAEEDQKVNWEKIRDLAQTTSNKERIKG